jgi:hypothetical protein
MYMIVFFVCHPIYFLSFVYLCCCRIAIAVCKWRESCYLVFVMTRCVFCRHMAVRIVVNAVQHLSAVVCCEHVAEHVSFAGIM